MSEESPEEDLFGENDDEEEVGLTQQNEEPDSPDENDINGDEGESASEEDEQGEEESEEDGSGEDEDEEDEEDEDAEEEEDAEGDEEAGEDDADADAADVDVDMDANGDEEEEIAPIIRQTTPLISPPLDGIRSPLAPIPANILRRKQFHPSFSPSNPPKSLSLDPFISIAHPVATHSLAATPCMSYLLTGSQDGYIRCYDFWASANGKALMTAQARGVANLGDGVTKGGVARGYWKNEVDVEEPEEVEKPKVKTAVAAPEWLQAEMANREPSPPPKMTVRRKLEPVYSLAIQGDGLWALSGSKTGTINLATVRHSPGTIIHALKGHTGPVSSLVLLPDEKSFISGSWDKAVKEWDLNTGKVVREYTKHGAHISAIQLRPAWRSVTVTAPELAQDTEGPSITVNFAPQAQDTAVDGDVEMDQPDNDNDAANIAKIAGQPEAPVEEAKSEEGDMDSLFGDDDETGGDGDKTILPMEVDATASVITSETVAADETVHPMTATTAPVPDVSPTKAKANRRRASTLKKADDLYSDDEAASPSQAGPVPRFATAAQPKIVRAGLPTLSPATYKDYSDDVMLVASMDGQVALHDRRVGTSRVGRLETTEKTPPWCMSACWSSDGNQVIAGRRQNTVDVWDVRKMGRSGVTGTPSLLKTLRNPAGSGPVSCVAAFPDGQHIACASHDTLRLWNTSELWNGGETLKKSKSGVPFRIVAGHRSGTVSAILIDPTCKYLVTASGDRGWAGESTQTVLIHEVK